MARPSVLMTLVVLALLSLQSVDAAGRPAKLQVIESSHSVHPSKYIVQFSRPPAADRRAQARVGASSSTLKSGAEQQHDDFAVYCRRNRLPVKISRKYSTLFNGAAVHVDNEQDLAKLAASPAVKKIFPVIRYSQTPQQPRPLNDKTVVPQFAHALTGVDAFRKQYPDVTGRDVKVAVVDSGIDWKHPAFAVPGQKCETFKGPGCRVMYGTDFVGSDYDADTPGKNIPKPDNDPMDDCNGHGVHCAGIIGGRDGTIEGVAPGVVFGAYKVFGCKGSVDNDVILAALEAAYQDGMEIINLSLGGGRVTSGMLFVDLYSVFPSTSLLTAFIFQITRRPRPLIRSLPTMCLLSLPLPTMVTKATRPSPRPVSPPRASALPRSTTRTSMSRRPSLTALPASPTRWPLSTLAPKASRASLTSRNPTR
ncbi:peptidase S8/S53 domain-containing protein [Catenaria anguillulae PL171]|uniref:Peptidase S8/S53 domain-containing protein n=1 Tax=Catenaria anguillulae PL171 TaxID=765915 RepID=A0A1Y2HWG4_9FUNG|nr:peptidase S8/S53 domain-containing protein [Catenaria anguillulae PL171]